MRTVIAGGGTAGHVNPALALAHALEGDAVTFAGTSGGAESKLVPAAGFPLEMIEVRGFDRSKPVSLVATGVQALRATGQARSLLRRVRADVVVGMGGYVSLPVCVAARRLKLPVVLHEQNIVLGLANRVCRRFARAVAVSFTETLEHAGPRGVFIGNPVRPEIAAVDHDADRARGHELFELDPQRMTLLVTGGSQGAKRLNEAALGLASLWAERDDLQILHLAGRVQSESFRKQTLGAAEGRLIYRVVDYVDDMVSAYAVADLALCRGGATTVAELGAVGLPAIVVPYPHHRDRQQERHGRVLERAGAAVVLLDDATTPAAVARLAG
ncbi:MAG: undecaprenyldiphospho-muramoylpentapeptide beta-N-acetylglucosaminyltransferase, partial [Actinomycetota bacterium]|nr:undecaprenyldiphospho-muramoylpentapeptide beta-N-acetylglucosaminyltransferase [Actinomycetota bacterium]